MRVNGPYYDARTDTWYLKEFHHAGRGGSRRLTYPTEQAAKKGLAKIEKILARPEETLRIYSCAQGAAYHVGHSRGGGAGRLRL